MGKHRFVIDGESFEVDVTLDAAGGAGADVLVNGRQHRAVRVPASSANAGASATVPSSAPGVPATRARATGRAALPAAGELRAPMAGRVLRVLAAPGQSLMLGEPLVVLDAMKMENTLGAPSDGVVAEVAVNVGDTVMQGALLVRLG